MSGNEASAIGSLRAINSAQASYAAAAGSGGYATTLVILGTPCSGTTGGFISPDLAGGASVLKSGYTVTMTGTGVAGPADCKATPTKTDYTASAVPLNIGTTGVRGFNTGSAGTIFVDPAGGLAGTTPLQ
jgi:hypothetical protein